MCRTWNIWNNFIYLTPDLRPVKISILTILTMAYNEKRPCNEKNNTTIRCETITFWLTDDVLIEITALVSSRDEKAYLKPKKILIRSPEESQQREQSARQCTFSKEKKTWKTSISFSLIQFPLVHIQNSSMFLSQKFQFTRSITEWMKESID